MGVTGIHPEVGLTTGDFEEAHVAAHTKQKVLAPFARLGITITKAASS